MIYKSYIYVHVCAYSMVDWKKNYNAGSNILNPFFQIEHNTAGTPSTHKYENCWELNVSVDSAKWVNWNMIAVLNEGGCVFCNVFLLTYH